MGRRACETSGTIQRVYVFLLVLLLACSPHAGRNAAQGPSTGEAEEPVSLPSELEQRLFALANAEREGAGRPALTWNPRLAEIARERATSLSRDATATKLPAETDARVRRMDLATSAFAENVARAPALEDAHRTWMANPQQRANILSLAVNQVGIAVVAVGDDAIFATELFAGIGAHIDAAQAARSVRASLPPSVKSDADLESIAQVYAEGLAAGSPSDQVWPTVASRLSEISRRYVKIYHTITTVADLAMLDPKTLLGRCRWRRSSARRRAGNRTRCGVGCRHDR